MSTLKESTGQLLTSSNSKQRAPATLGNHHITKTPNNPLTLEQSQSNMGVASVLSKRRLESSDLEMISPVPSKVPRKAEPDSLDDKYSSEYLTTSILARTLLTSVHSNPTQSSSNPLECLKSTLEALPAPTFLESLEELTGSSCSSNLLSSLPKLTTDESSAEVEFGNLLCAETVVTVLSPIDENECRSNSWNSGIPSTTISTFDQVITKEENGKSYFNLGSSDTTLIAKKTSPCLPTDPAEWNSPGTSNNTDYLDEASSSSSCESISSDDLFNSCEEYDDDDPSEDDEDEVRSYKQERSTVLHLSLCKLNSFRTQNCVEPSLHRSVLICNTLRQIEQEIRNEDEASKFLRTKEKLPSLWPSRNNNSRQQFQEPPRSSSTANNNNSSYLNSYSNDPPYSNTTEPPVTYDYNSSIDRPSQTPFHTASFDYSEVSSNHFTELASGNQSPSSALLECDSGYAEDIDLALASPFYYSSSGGSNLDFAPPNPTNFVTIPEYSNVELPVTITETPDSLPTLETLQQVVLKSSPEINDITTVDSSLEISNSGSDSSSSSTDDSDESWAGVVTRPPSTSILFPQQETNCGMESLRKDYNFTNSNQYPAQISMDHLISDSYSST